MDVVAHLSILLTLTPRPPACLACLVMLAHNGVGILTHAPPPQYSSAASSRCPCRSHSRAASTWSSERDASNEASSSASTLVRLRRPRDIDAPAPPKKGKRPPPWTPSDSLGETQHWICIKGMPVTSTTSDVARVLDSATLRDDSNGSSSATAPSSSSSSSAAASATGLSKYISDVLPVYRPTSLRTTDRFLLRLLHERHEDTLLRHLNGRLYAGHELSAIRCTAEGAATLLGSNLIACSSRAYDARAHGSVTDFVRAIVARSASNDGSSGGAHATQASTYSTHGSGGAGSVVLLRGLPPGVKPDLLVRRFGRRYTLAAPGGPRNRTSLWDRTQGTWAPVQLEQVIQLWVANSAQEARDARRDAEVALRSVGTQDEFEANTSPSNGSNKTSMFLLRMGSAAHAHALLRRLHGRRWSTLPASVRYGGAGGARTFSRAEHPEGQGLLGEIEGFDEGEGEEGEEGSGSGYDSLVDKVDEDGVPLYGDGMEDDGGGRARGAAKPRHHAMPGEVVSGLREYVVEVQVMY